ncbi:AAA family ATPase, partial [uncultured Campylobacter sp.]|uniref:AAA family ATPase n=1 Tax=uncultured Campylobacter sp. TaxID=218934 RepID=UPI002606C64C
MKLDRFEIKNFRSIKDMAINIEERNGKKCIILVGKNEAGKSNILKAISAVFGQYEVSIKDQNKNATDDKYYIRAIFKLEENDFNVLETGLFEEYNIKDTNIFQNNLDIRNFIKESFNEILLTIKIDDNEEPRLTYWSYKTLDKKYKILRSVYYEQNSKQITVSSKENSIGNELSINDLKNIIFTNIENYIVNIEELYNNMIFWEYNDQYLLPSSLNIEDFKNDPDICIPLKNIFYLNNITDIEQDIENASKKDKGLHGFLERISKEATKEFRKIWPDLDNIEFIIRKDGEEFDIRIKEKE